MESTHAARKMQLRSQESNLSHLHVHNTALRKSNRSPSLPLQELGLDMPQGSQDEEGAAQQSLAQVGSPLWHWRLPFSCEPQLPGQIRYRCSQWQPCCTRRPCALQFAAHLLPVWFFSVQCQQVMLLGFSEHCPCVTATSSDPQPFCL